MAYLVKTCKTIHLAGRLDWTSLKVRAMGVKFIDNHRTTMIFNRNSPGNNRETVVLGFNHLPLLRTCSLYDGRCDGVDLDGEETLIVKSVLEAVAGKKNRIVESRCEYSVFRVDASSPVDVYAAEQTLVKRGISAVLEYELQDSLFITYGGVTWRVSDQAPRTIFASVPELPLSEALIAVAESRKTIGLF